MVARGLKICLAVSFLFLIIVTTVIVALALTVFKPKDPDISVHPFGLENLNFSMSPNINVTIGMLITIVNPNYGSFNYINSTGYVNYRDTIVAEVPIMAEFVPARTTINVTTNAIFMIGKLLQNPKFWSDIIIYKTLNMTSTASLPGKVGAFKIIKFTATAYSLCDISINVSSKSADTYCISKIKL